MIVLISSGQAKGPVLQSSIKLNRVGSNFEFSFLDNTYYVIYFLSFMFDLDLSHTTGSYS